MSTDSTTINTTVDPTTATTASVSADQPTTLEELRVSHAALVAANTDLTAQHAAATEVSEDRSAARIGDSYVTRSG